MLSEAMTRIVHVDVAAEPELSRTLTLISKFPDVVGVPETVMLAPLVAEGENGPLTVQVYTPDPPETDNGKLNGVPVAIGLAGHVLVI